MTITNTSYTVNYTGNDSTTVWTYAFPIMTAGAVIATVTDLTTGVITTLTPSQYTITGIADAAGGTLTYPKTGSPLTSNDKITITRDTPNTQLLEVNNQTGFNPTVYEDQLDLIVMQLQEFGGIVSAFSVFEGTSILSTGEAASLVLKSDGAGGASWATDTSSPEGTTVLSTGVTSGWVLQADGDNTSSWVALAGGGDFLASGAVPMTGDFDGGSNAITNVTNITVSGQFKLDDDSYITLNGGTDPFWRFDLTDYMLYTRSTNTYNIVIGGVERMALTTSGLKLASGETVNEFSSDGTLAGNSSTAVPVESAVKAYVDASNTSNVIIQGGYNATTNTPDLDTSPSGLIKHGWMYTVTAAGVFFTANVEIGDTITALQDAPTAESHWVITNKNLDAPSVKVLYESNADTNEFTDAEKTSLAAVAINDVLTGFYNGAAIDSPAVTVTSNGTVITLSLEKSGGGDIDFKFSDGVHSHDCTPAATIALTAGTDNVFQSNFVYILQSTKALTVSASGWPSAEHAPIATVCCQTAASMQTVGAMKMHAYTDHVAGSDSMGHLAHINRWIRNQPAKWLSGVAVTPTVGVATFDIATSVGEVFQLHPHAMPAFDTSSGSKIYMANYPSDNYKEALDLTQTYVDVDINGTTLGDTATDFYNLVIWGVVNEASGDCKLFVNLPDGAYNNDSAGKASNDIDGTAVYTIPAEFTGVGFLIARLTVRENGGTYTIEQNTDLRGLTPSTEPGGAPNTTSPGRQTMNFPASSFTVPASGGPDAGKTTEGTYGHTVDTFDFSGSVEEEMFLTIPFPKSYDGGDLYFDYEWISAHTGTGGCYFLLEAVNVADNEDPDIAYGTAVAVTDNGQSAAERVLTSAESAAVTPAGTWTYGETTQLRFYRNPAHANDTITEDVRIRLGNIYYNTTSIKDD